MTAPPNRKGWTPDKQARLRELWEADFPIRDIAADPGINRPRDDVREMAKALGLPKRSKNRRGAHSDQFVDRMPRQIEKWPRDMGRFEDHPRAS